MRFLFKLIQRSKRLEDFLYSSYQSVREEQQPVIVNSQIPEITPIVCRNSDTTTPRLNLILPALSTQYVFGGIATALTIFMRAAETYTDIRIILSDEADFAHAGNPAFNEWHVLSMDDPDVSGRCIVSAGIRNNKTLVVRPRDQFICTGWWTAHIALEVLQWQAETYSRPLPKMGYLIQDFEPGFYPWSSRYALAESTYHHPERTVVIFNTSMLQEYFTAEGYRFPEAYVLEPTLNAGLAASLHQPESVPKERRILVYGRPSVERNAFAILLAGIMAWAKRDPRSAEWEVLSVGEEHYDVELPNGNLMKSLGKLTIDGYASELKRAAIGISLMISPHPSYPPLEMAAFGLHVITNRYKNKDLSKLHANITSLEWLSAESLSDGISACLDTFYGDNAIGGQGERFGSFHFVSSHDSFEFIPKFVELIEASYRIESNDAQQ